LDSDDNKCKIIHREDPARNEARRIQSAIQSEMVMAEVINTYRRAAWGPDKDGGFAQLLNSRSADIHHSLLENCFASYES